MNKHTGILVVDDTLSALKLLVGVLAAEGYPVRPVTSGESALAAIQTAPPELILLDIRMPGMDGFEVCRRIKATESTRDIPILFLSATTESDERVKGFEMGAVDFIPKPFQREELLARVRTHLDLSRLRTQLECQVTARTREVVARTEDLRASEEKFSAAFEFSPMAISITTLDDQTYMEVNRTFEDYTGYTRDEVIGHTAIDLSLWVDLESRARAFQKLRTEGSCHDFEFQFRTKKGDVRKGRSSAKVFKFSGRSCFLTLTEDITEHSLLEDQLRQAQKLEAVGQLAGGVAHDFNNILTAMRLNLSLLQDEPHLPDEVKSGLKELQTEALRASSLTRQLLMFSRRQNTDSKPIDLNEIVQSMTKMLNRLMREDIELKFDNNGASHRIMADTGMMEQMVMNLCVNARDAMEHGGRLAINISQAQIDVVTPEMNPAARPGSFARLSVSDEGCGMNEITLKRIFEPFFTTKEVGKGTGLGLATVFGIVKRHHGWIDVESAVGKGSVFHIYLPSLTNDEIKVAAICDDDIRGGSETILVVEDEQSMRRAIALGLRKLGYGVFEAVDANHALSIWAQHRQIIDLLLTDVVMPGGLSGLDLAKRLRNEKKSLQIIISSGYNTIASNPDTLMAQGVGVLAKPYDSVILARAVRSSLDQVADGKTVQNL